MNTSTPGNEVLMRYLDGECSPGEINEVENRLASDPEFRQAYENLLVAREAIRQYSIRDTVKRAIQQEKNTVPALVRSISGANVWKRFAAVAASLLLIAGAWFLYSFFNLSNEKLYREHYISYQVSTTRGTDNGSTIEALYRTEQYQQLITRYRENPDSSPTLNFYSAMSYFQLSQPAAAIEPLEYLARAESPAHPYREDADYYLALAYLHNRDYDAALTRFRSIYEDPEHAYHQRVDRRLLRKLKWLKWK
jgi:hypothetical protein